MRYKIVRTGRKKYQLHDLKTGRRVGTRKSRFDCVCIARQVWYDEVVRNQEPRKVHHGRAGV